MTIDPRLIAAIVIAVVLSAGSAAVGFTVGGWKAEAAHASELKGINDRLTAATAARHDLELAVAEANKALAVAEAQTKAAEQLQAQATANAEALASFSKSRLDKLATAVATATGCSDVLGKYWELKQ